MVAPVLRSDIRRSYRPEHKGIKAYFAVVGIIEALQPLVNEAQPAPGSCTAAMHSSLPQRVVRDRVER